jgi:predicted permease
MNLINVIVYIIIALSVVVVPICIIVGFIIGVSGSKTDDETAKKSRKKLAWNVALYPIVLTIIVIVIWGLVNILVRGAL